MCSMRAKLVTIDATLDDLSIADYRAIYDELRPYDPDAKKRMPQIRAFCEQIGWKMAPVHWSNWESGKGNLTRAMRSALRVAVGKTPLPQTVADVIAANASPDAAVWQIGDDVADTVVMLTQGDARFVEIGITKNDDVQWTTLRDGATSTHNGDVTALTMPQAERKPKKRTLDPWREPDVIQRRKALKRTLREVIYAGLEALEQRKEQDGDNAW